MKNAPMNDREKAVFDYLQAVGITYAAAYSGPEKRDAWDCDHWRVTLKAASGASMSTDFYTGLGHRKSARPMPAELARLRPAVLARKQWEAEHLKPVTPNAASVLYSLLSDARAGEQPFDYWAADHGYDTDSIKALGIYNACCEIRRELYRVITAAQRADLEKLLEDY